MKNQSKRYSRWPQLSDTPYSAKCEGDECEGECTPRNSAI